MGLEVARLATFGDEVDVGALADLGVGALILLTPYSTRTWTQDDQTYLSLAAEKVGLLLEQSQTSTGMMQEIEALRSKLAQVRTTQSEGHPQTSSFTEKFGTGDI